MIEFTVNGKKNSVPASFDEFTMKYWKYFFASVSSGKAKTWNDLKLLFLSKFTNIPFRKLQKLYGSKHNVDLEEFSQHFSKLYPIIEKLKYIEEQVSVSKNPLPVLRYGRFMHKKLFPPSDGLSNLKTWEMALATKAAKDYEASGNEDYLHALIATIYRPGRPFWKMLRKFGYFPDDRRRRFYDALIDVYAPKLKNIPDFKKKLILWWFGSQYKIFSQRFSELFIGASGTSGDDFSWADMIVSCENSMPGDEKKISDSYASFFLHRLVVQKRQIEELKEKSKPKK